MKRIALFLIGLLVLGVSFRPEKIRFEIPDGWPRPTYDFSKNPLTEEKAALGRMLFYDPLLSRNNTISCASCHSPFNAFAHSDHALSHGINDSIGSRNAPGLFNLAWQRSFMWDGAINHLDVQALAPINHPREMGEDFKNVIEKLNGQPSYRGMFYRAFHDSVATGERTLKSISQFMITLVSNQSRYDSAQRGQTTFTTQESNGYSLFKANCANCHQEPLFTNRSFERNGLSVDPQLNDQGRAKVSGDTSDSLRFKVPSLRNVEYTAPYMHDGRFKKLRDVIQYYGSADPASFSIQPTHAIVLTPNQKTDLLAFLLTLSDKKFLMDPSHWDPAMVASRGGNRR